MNKILEILLEEKETKLKGSLYHLTQIKFSYNSNHIEGSKLTEDETRYIYETNSFIGDKEKVVSIDDILSDPVKYAEEYANKYGITVVLKSHQSVIAAKEDTFINKSGSAAMAKAGSGDVLCGIIAGMFCLGIDDDMAVALGVFIHGMAGSIAGKKYGEHSILAREIIDNIGEVLNRRKRNGLI